MSWRSKMTIWCCGHVHSSWRSVVSGVNNSFSYYYSFLTTTTTPVAGYAQGSELWVVNASNSSLAISVYVPPMLCAIENCPFGTCDQSSNTCTSGASFPSDIGLGTVARAYSTYYCNLSPSSDQCDGPPGSGPLSAYSAASGVANALAYPVCAMTDEGYDYRVPCVGVAAVPARMLGNLQLDRDPYNNSVANWQLGMSAASGVCHELIGSTGKHAIVVTVARCDGVCSCGGGCNTTCSLASNCLSSASMRPSCSCVGGGGAPGQCCGFNSVHNNDSCATANPVSDCDWCAAGTHPHFAVDFATYYILCSDSELGGGCRLQSVRPFICMQPLAGTIWPFKSQAAAVCGASSFLCSVSPSPLNPMVPGCPCCCNNGFLPSNATGAQSVGSSNCTCVPRASVSALPACGGNATWCSYSTSAATPMTPSCSCCCVAGTTPTNATCSCA
eukprot:gnl/Spiro4/2703_TR1306_c0_g1_i2.p1 gnl/Spiro4/2703_TR1306_c0_g1~~gnl/Spiro4/2703_TR1306_c0_g1_i2.p1  ORF type:complete len:444 (+),score=42.89 gnl/Spiro4/2703_TR1306_c0_g1_i2:263-1594(+)